MRIRGLGRLKNLITRLEHSNAKQDHLDESERWFLSRAANEQEKQIRKSLADGFRRVNSGVACAHGELEALLMADYLLRSPLPGAMVECGCYKGGSTAKLSLVAKATGRHLMVCDSFQGLPEPPERDRFHHWFVSRKELPYRQGEYQGTIEEVKANIGKFGAADVCEYVPGYFADTLGSLKVGKLSFVFMDVDYISSARDCLQSLWPTLEMGGRYYTHEAGIEEFIYGVTDSAWWHEVMGCCSPQLIGAGYGCGAGASDLGFFDKNQPASVVGKTVPGNGL